MDLNESINAGLTVVTINQETGEVQFWEFENGRKFTRRDVTYLLETVCGWYVGKLLFKEEEDHVEILNENHSHLADIGKKLADSFRKARYVKYIS